MKRKEETDLIYREESYAIVWACFAVYCYEKIILEIKAVSVLCDEDRGQLLNYLSATGYQLGLLVNLGYYPRIEYERLLARKHETVDLFL